MLTKPRLTAVAWFFLLLQGATAKSAQLQLVYISDPPPSAYRPFLNITIHTFWPTNSRIKTKKDNDDSDSDAGGTQHKRRCRVEVDVDVLDTINKL